LESHGSQALVSDPAAAALSPFIEVEQLRELGPAHFGPSPFVLEIGFGRGELLLTLAPQQPARTFFGLEISRKRVLKMERRIQRAEVANIRVMHAPAQYVVERVLPSGSLSECWIHCPDPWPKKRHHRRRLIQPAFVAELVRVLAPGGRLYLSTDHPGYAEWMYEVLSQAPGLRTLTPEDRWSSVPPERPRTAYEEEWIADGRRIAYFAYERLPDGAFDAAPARPSAAGELPGESPGCS